MKNYSKIEKLAVFLDSFLGLEYKFKYQLLLDAPEELEIENYIIECERYISSTVGENEYRTIKNSAKEEYIENIFSQLEKKNIFITTYFSEDYPSELLNITCPPLVLYYKGDLSVLDNETFGIVGSRKSLPISLKITQRYASELVGAGFTLITGIAEGVDKTVLNTALDNDGLAVSIIAGGLDNIYPKSHAELISRVEQKGLVLSEYPPETFPKPFHFPVRNRLIAGLSKGVLIVSGGKNSGTLYTAEYANDFSKDLFAIPYSVDIPSGAGCNELIKKGALLTDTPQDILDFYGKTAKKEKIELTNSEKQIVSLLKDGSLHIEKLCTALSKQVFEVTPLLSVLEIKGIVVKSGNVYGLTRNDLED